MFSVPSVEPAKYTSYGYGSRPADGWNSAAVATFGGGGVAPPGVPLKPVRVSVPTPPTPPLEHPPGSSAPQTMPAAMIFFMSLDPARAQRAPTGAAAVRMSLPPVLFERGRGELGYAYGKNSGKVRPCPLASQAAAQPSR